MQKDYSPELFTVVRAWNTECEASVFSLCLPKKSRKKNIPAETIAECVGLTLEQVKELSEKITVQA